MMDYNIYIRSIGEQSEGSPTSSWNPQRQSETQAWQPSATRTISSLGNPDGLVSAGVSALVKALPWVAVACAVVKTGLKVYDTALEFSTAETGDYRATMERRNFKAALSWVTSPFSNALNYMKAQQGIRIEDQKREEHRKLLGDSEINSLYGRGV